MGHVAVERLRVLLGQAGGLLLEQGEHLPGQLHSSLQHHAVVGQADVGLLAVQLAELLVGLPQLQGAVQQVGGVLLYVLADEAVLLPGVGRRHNLFGGHLALGEHLLPHGGQQAFQNQRHGKPAAPGQNLVEVLGAEAQAVCLHPHVGLHHGRAGDVGGHAVLQHVAHAAEGAAVLGHEYIVYGDGANIFSHGKNLPIRCSTNFVHKYTFWVFREKQAALWGPFVKTRRKTRGFAASIPQNRGIA